MIKINLHSVLYMILYQLLYYWGLISKKTNDFLKSFKNNNDIVTCTYIQVENNKWREDTYDIYKSVTFDYNFVIITNSKNESIICFENFEQIKNKYIAGIDIFKLSNYEFLSYNINLNEKQYEINLKDDNYNFLIVNNNIGNPTFIHWYLLKKYNLDLSSVDNFKKNENNYWSITLIDSDANIKENIICKSIILNESDYKIIN